MQYIGHKRITLYRLAMKYSKCSRTLDKCDVEYKHFKLHRLNNIAIEILNIQNKYHKCLFSWAHILNTTTHSFYMD